MEFMHSLLFYLKNSTKYVLQSKDSNHVPVQQILRENKSPTRTYKTNAPMHSKPIVYFMIGIKPHFRLGLRTVHWSTPPWSVFFLLPRALVAVDTVRHSVGDAVRQVGVLCSGGTGGHFRSGWHFRCSRHFRRGWHLGHRWHSGYTFGQLRCSLDGCLFKEEGKRKRQL